jgi:CO/xanthine dehydrogenase Mo-binding subunit
MFVALNILEVKAMPLVGGKDFKVLNQSISRVDGLEKVTGRAQYTADLTFPNMIYGGMLRSGLSSAKVTKIDTIKAKAIPGVHAVVTFKDMPKTKSWAGYMYLTDHIRYQGDCVAMVAAETKELVDEALAAIEVEYEELPGVFTIDDALKEDAPLVHAQYPNNIFKESHFSIRKGDVEDAFSKADVVLEREYRTQFVEHAYIEPEAVIALENPTDGLMTVHASAQNPFFTRRYAADVLGYSLNRVRLIQQVIGGTFGGKEEGVGLITGRAAYLAHLTKRPVKIVFSREESFLESSKRHPFRLRYKIGATKEGKIIALDGELVDNSGAYNNQTQFMNWRANVHSAGPYVIDNIKTDVFGVFTNNIHSGAFRGYSSPSLIFAQEQLIDELAEELGMDEVELRRINCLKSGSLTATSQKVDDVILEEVMDYTVEQTGYKEKRDAYKKLNQTGAKRKGIGMAVCYRGCGLGAESPDAAGAMVIANEDGSILITSGLAENGQGLKTAYSQICAEGLGVKVEDIHFYGTDTHAIPDGGMTVASRGTVMGAQSMRKAAEQLKQIMINNAIELCCFSAENIEQANNLEPGAIQGICGTNPEDIELEDGYFFLKKYPEYKKPFKEVCNACLWTGKQMATFAWHTPGPLVQDHHTGQGPAFPTYAYGCIIAEVEVDTETGYVDVLKVTSSHDVGTAVNPSLVKGQVYGGIAMGQGYAVMEDVEVSKGKVGTQNLDSYIIPTAMDVPEMQVNIFECADEAGTYGAKSIGEPATEGVGAAIANAIYNATGKRFRDNPADLEKVLLGKRLR